MVRAQNPQDVGEQLLERGGRTGRIPRLTPPAGETVTGGQGVGMVRAQDPQPVGEQLLERGGRTGRIPGLPPPVGEIVTGGQGVGMIVAEFFREGGKPGAPAVAVVGCAGPVEGFERGQGGGGVPAEQVVAWTCSGDVVGDLGCAVRGW